MDAKGWMGVVVLVAATAACSGSPTGGEEVELGSRSDAVAAEPGEEVTLGVGATARWDAQGITVTYRRLVGDSRCPLEAVCVWEGDAEVLLAISVGDGEAREEALHTTLVAGPRALGLDGWRLELVRVDPYPSVNVEPDPARSVAVLRLAAGG